MKKTKKINNEPLKNLNNRILKIVLLVILVITNIITWGSLLFVMFYQGNVLLFFSSKNYRENQATAALPPSPAADCNVMYIPMRGTLLTYLTSSELSSGYGDDLTASDYIIGLVDQADQDDQIAAIILEVDSLGGSPVAAEEVANALKRTGKPVVALIRQSGISAAYWAASGADLIYASANSDVGGIGVTMSYLDNVERNKLEGLSFVQLSAGQFKDAGNPDKLLTLDEKKLYERDLNIIYENFVSAVAQNRNLSVEDVRPLADGSSMLGQMALASGLIDRIGGLADVKDFLRVQIENEVRICER